MPPTRTPGTQTTKDCIASISGYNSDMAKSRDKGNKEVKKPKKKK
jgi:hypothetical protein